MKKTILIVAVLLALCFPLQTLAAETSEDPLEPETKSWYTFEGLGVDEADLNATYNALQDQLLANGFGEEFKLQFPDTEGYSMNAVQLFKDTYGDLWGTLQMDTPKIPENFSASDFLKQGMDIRDDLYDGVKQNELYQSVMSQMNVDTIWNTASNGLPSVSSLLENSFEQDFSMKTEGEKENNQNYLSGIQEDALDLFTQSGSLLSESNKNSFWAAVEDMKDILSEGGNMGELFEKMK